MMSTAKTLEYDVVIVGGGAAGLSAALVLGRGRRLGAFVDSGSPRNAPAAHMHGFLSRDGFPPTELLARGRAELAAYGVDVVTGDVLDIDRGFSVVLASGTALSARRLLIATGATDDLPDLEGARERWGRDFLHCPYCHGWEVRDQALGVVGTGHGSSEHALLLRQWSDDVVFFTHTYSLTAAERTTLAHRGIYVVDGIVVRLLVENDHIEGVELADGRAFARDAIFIRPSLRPRGSDLIRSLGCDVNEHGFVRVDGTGRTTVDGVWAAGNVANPRAQVITAAGEGSAAAIAINNDLVEEDSRLPVAATAATHANGDE